MSEEVIPEDSLIGKQLIAYKVYGPLIRHVFVCVFFLHQVQRVCWIYKSVFANASLLVTLRLFGTGSSATLPGMITATTGQGVSVCPVPFSSTSPACPTRPSPGPAHGLHPCRSCLPYSLNRNILDLPTHPSLGLSSSLWWLPWHLPFRLGEEGQTLIQTLTLILSPFPSSLMCPQPISMTLAFR